MKPNKNSKSQFGKIMSSKIKEINDDSFENEVLKSEIPVLVDFFAQWCSPCARQLPILEEVAVTEKDFVKIVKVDIDESPSTATEFKVRSIPTLILFKQGKPVKNNTGLMSKSAVQKFLNGE